MKVFFKTALFLLVTHFAAGQQIRIGAKGAFNLSNVSKFELADQVLPDFKMLPSGGGGLFAEIPLSNDFSFRPEVSFAVKGSRLEDINLGKLIDQSWASLINAEARILLSYIDVPLLVKYKFGKSELGRGYIIAGPGLAFKVGDDLKMKFLGGAIPTQFPLNLDYNPVEFSGHVGAGYEFPLGNNITGFVEAKYQQGFTNIVKDWGAFEFRTRNQNVGISAGISIPLGARK